MIFVDSNIQDEEVRRSSPTEFFDTFPEFLNRKFNRPRKSKINKELIISNANEISLKELKANERERIRSYKVRVEREREISTKTL
jgi:U3 small nucleolar RNA-associated protein 11